MLNNNNMMGNMMPNVQNFNNFNNNGNNVNNNNFMMNNGMNMCCIPNMNVNLQGMNLNEAKNWQEIYQNQNIQQIQNNGGNMDLMKVNVIFTTTMGITVNMKVNFGKRVCDLIELYFKLINREDLYKQPQDLCFICNAKIIDCKDQTPVERFFRSGFARITINDVRGLIGA